MEGKKTKSAMVFIDGNNLYHNLKVSGIKPGDVNLKKLSEYICKHFGYVHKKSIYYNSTPDIREGEKKYYDHMKFLQRVAKIPKFEVKTRKLQKHSNKEIIKIKERALNQLDLCKNCSPIVISNCNECIGGFNTKEKGIDVMIAIDMVYNTIVKDNCDCSILLSGDSDFIPAMDLIKKSGKKPLSAALYKGYSHNLRSAHGWFILDRDKLLENCR